METVKNTVSHFLGGHKEGASETSSEEHGHHQQQQQHDDQIAGTTATTTDSATDSTTAGNTASFHDQTTSPADISSKSTSTGNSGGNDLHAQSAEGHSHGGHDHSAEGHDHGHHDHHDHFPEGADRVQSPDQGPDPALVGDAHAKDKLTGTGAPGSHSALFGLTPDGKKSTEASKGSGAPQAAHSGDTAVGGGKPTEEGDNTSRAPTGGSELRDQMHRAEADPGRKGGERTDPAPLPAGGDTKPGAGATGLQQGTGDI